jgi:hypothetical protein
MKWRPRHRKLRQRPVTLPSWDSARRLVRSAELLDDYARQHLQGALARSDAQLAPLCEPLRLNLGAHRWLSADREESYSDWLAWIIQGMTGAAEILPLFGLGDEETIHELGAVESVVLEGTTSVVREETIKDGRTDIRVSFGTRGLLLIEVKVQRPGRDLLSQLKREWQWTKQQEGRKLLVLLGVEDPAQKIGKFEFAFTGWQTLCMRLRRNADSVKQLDVMRAATILIFCAAVEQNLLGLSARPRRFRAMASVDYL